MYWKLRARYRERFVPPTILRGCPWDPSEILGFAAKMMALHSQQKGVEPVLTAFVLFVYYVLCFGIHVEADDNTRCTNGKHLPGHSPGPWDLPGAL